MAAQATAFAQADLLGRQDQADHAGLDCAEGDQRAGALGAGQGPAQERAHQAHCHGRVLTGSCTIYRCKTCGAGPTQGVKGARGAGGPGRAGGGGAGRERRGGRRERAAAARGAPQNMAATARSLALSTWPAVVRFGCVFGRGAAFVARVVAPRCGARGANAHVGGAHGGRTGGAGHQPRHRHAGCYHCGARRRRRPCAQL